MNTALRSRSSLPDIDNVKGVMIITFKEVLHRIEEFRCLGGQSVMINGADRSGFRWSGSQRPWA